MRIDKRADCWTVKAGFLYRMQKHKQQRPTTVLIKLRWLKNKSIYDIQWYLEPFESNQQKILKTNLIPRAFSMIWGWGEIKNNKSNNALASS